MARQEIDLTTPQPNGKMGEPTKAAWEKVNDMTFEIYGSIDSNVRIFGAKGDGTTDDSSAINQAISSSQIVKFPTGNFLANSEINLPFGKVAEFDTGASITGSGTKTFSGTIIKKGNNPGSLSGWTSVSPYNFEGLSVDVGGYGNRQFGAAGIPTAVNGSIKVPSTSTIANHAAGVTGYADTSSTTTGAVALYGEGNSRADNSLCWGINTRSQDNGFVVPTMWGAEIDMNVSNVNTIPVGVEVVGGSTVEPTQSIGFKCSPLNPFNTIKIRWNRAFMSDDGAAKIGLEIGAQQNQANSPAQSIIGFFRRNGNVRATAYTITTDGDGNTIFAGGITGAGGTGAALFDITGNPSGPAPVRINGGNLGFFGKFPVGKGTVTGSKGGNVALDSLLIELERIGLINNSST